MTGKEAVGGSEAAESETAMSESLKRLDVGQFVRFCDEDRRWHDALVTAVHGDAYMAPIFGGKSYLDGKLYEGPDCEIPQYPCVNLSFVSSDPDAQDQYGRQMVRDKTSISHFGQYVASGFFWCHQEDEEEALGKLCEALKDIKS